MKTYKIGMFASSLAGHDKGCLYVILGLDNEYAYLSDGRLRPVEKQKKKRFCHIQCDCHMDTRIQDCLGEGKMLGNDLIKNAIKKKKEDIRR